MRNDRTAVEPKTNEILNHSLIGNTSQHTYPACSLRISAGIQKHTCTIMIPRLSGRPHQRRAPSLQSTIVTPPNVIVFISKNNTIRKYCIHVSKISGMKSDTGTKSSSQSKTMHSVPIYGERE